MLKKILCTAGVVLLMAFSGTQAADIDAAVAEGWKAGAERGEASAQCALAMCYDFVDCEGIPHDYAKARQWYEKAAAQGEAEAQFKLGLMYDEGKGVRQDHAEARKWFEKAAAQGNAEAQSCLGFMYEKGQGVPQDYVKARKWYEKAAAQGDIEAQFNLGIMYAEGQGVPQNKRTAKEWFGKACDNGNQMGCNAYLELNEAGFSGTQAADCDAACVAMTKARAERGIASAQGALAACYYLGNCEGIPQDYSKAREWFKKACDNGHPGGCDAYRKLNEAGF